MNNRQFPWLILVPRRTGKRELFELAPDDYRLAMEEIRAVSHAMATLTTAHKMNLATLGNIVPQLHIHIIARFEHDAAWPNPIWNHSTDSAPYTNDMLADVMSKIRTVLNITKM